MDTDDWSLLISGISIGISISSAIWTIVVLYYKKEH